MSHLGTITDAPPNFLKNSNASLKVETLKEGVGVRSLARNTWGVRGVCWSFGMGIMMSGKWVNMDLHKQSNKLVSA